jgi:hypothetical protein
MKFGYLRDPLFLACFAGYWLHRLLAWQDLSHPWLRAYGNDLICLPFWTPLLVWVQRRVGLRDHDGPPTAVELAIPLVIWAAVFEVLLPATATWNGLAFPDPVDVLCYAAGGLAAALFWRWRYGVGQPLWGEPIGSSVTQPERTKS